MASGFPPEGRPRQPGALEPAKLADFQIASALGAGTTAKVYRAVHLPTGRQVAIKMIEPSQAGTEMRERFAREAILLASVASKHVGNIVGFGFERGQPFLVLDLLRGETLDAKLRRDGPVPLHLATRWVEELLLGVRDIHDRQIIHRDIKPSNIFLHREGGGRDGRGPASDETVKLIDFGVARLKEVTGDTGGLTSTNHLIGSMGYMAPEQFKNAKTVGFAADLYAVGVCIFRILTGRLPFVSRSLEAVVRMKTEQRAPLVSSLPGMPHNERLDWFVVKTMAGDPQARFQSARDMLEQWGTVRGSLDAEAVADGLYGDAVGVEERTVPRPFLTRPRTGEEPARSPSAAPAARRPSSPPSSTQVVESSELDAPETVLDRPPVHVGAPGTVIMGSLGRDPTPPPDPPEPSDPTDMPTRNEPGLKHLVQRELELYEEQKKRTPKR